MEDQTEEQENGLSFRHQSKVAYVLGAGFSRPAGVPLLRDFIPAALRDLKDNPQDRKLAGKLDRLLEKYSRLANAVQIDLDNLEHLFCLVDLPSGRVGGRSAGKDEDERDRATLKEVIVRTSVLAYQRAARRQEFVGVPRCHLFLTPEAPFKSPARGSLDVTFYEAFLSYLLHCNSSRGHERTRPYDLDSIITLNYDLVIEETMKCFPKATVYYGDGILDNRADCGEWNSVVPTTDAPRSVLVPMLKLHGSVHWYCEPTAEIPGTEGPVQHRKDFPAVTRLWDPAEGRAPCNIQFENVPLVPPTWRKQSSEYSIFAAMVKQAILHLRRAAKIVIIGYSMPESDAHFRYMLAKGLWTPEFPEIEVWDVRGKDVMNECLTKMFGRQNLERNRVVYSDQGFEGFVKRHSYEESAKIRDRVR